MGCNVSSGGCNAVDAAMMLYAGSARTATEQTQQRKELDLLWKLTKGNVWDTQTDSTAAYQKTVPSGAVAAEIGSIGGKTVAWNQLVDTDTEAVTTISGRKYLTSIGGTDSIITSDGTDISVTGGTDKVFDLTQMFGTSEPTAISDPRIAAIIAYAESHPEYDAGSLLSAAVSGIVSKNVDAETLGTIEIPVSLRTFLADKGYGWSAGSAYNELKLESKKYIQRVGSVDLGTLEWNPFDPNAVPGCYYALTTFRDAGNANIIIEKYVCNRSIISAYSLGDGEYYFGSVSTSRIYVRDTNYSTSDTFKSAMSGVTLYYELAEPIEYDISSYLTDDNTMTVDPGGTLTFVQDGTALEVPNSVEYLIKLSEVTE